MPLYEYICPDCGVKFEMMRPISCSAEDVPCPQCKSQAKRVLSSFAAFSKDESGLVTPTAGGSACSSCSSGSCNSCDL